VNEPLVFGDLVGPDREPTVDEERELLEPLAREGEAEASTVSMGRSNAADDPGPILTRDAEGWRAGRYVGELRRAGHVLEIRPRLGVETLASWAAAALGVRTVVRAAEHRGTAALIAEIMAASWRSALVDAARHGPPGIRRPRPHRGLAAKGRIDVPATLRLRQGGRSQLASISRPRAVDNPITRAIVCADRVLNRRLAREGWRGDRVAELMPRLWSATGQRPKLPTRRDLDRVRFTPITLPYKRVAELSHQIASNKGLRAQASAESAEGFLIDVAELWELFLLHCARRAFPGEARHGTRDGDADYLLSSVSPPGRRLGKLLPDLILGPPSRPWAILDAKYKPLAGRRGVDREDLYQLTSYMSADAGRGEAFGALLYPEFGDNPGEPPAYEGRPWELRSGQRVTFERVAVTEATAISQLRSLGRSMGANSAQAQKPRAKVAVTD